MRHPIQGTLFATVVALGASDLLAQGLRNGINSADLVAVARQVGKKPHNDQVTLHRVQIISNVFGSNGNTAVTVLDWPKLSLHQRPSPRQARLYCLKSASVTHKALYVRHAKRPSHV